MRAPLGACAALRCFPCRGCSFFFVAFFSVLLSCVGVAAERIDHGAARQERQEAARSISTSSKLVRQPDTEPQQDTTLQEDTTPQQDTDTQKATVACNMDTGRHCRHSAFEETCGEAPGGGSCTWFGLVKSSKCLCPPGFCAEPPTQTCVAHPLPAPAPGARLAQPVTTRGKVNATFIKNDAVELAMPFAHEGCPEVLEGIYWMDEHGYYGHSNLALPTGNYAVSFCEPGSLDKDSRTLKLYVGGPAFPFPNNAAGYNMKNRKAGLTFTFGDESYESASVQTVNSAPLQDFFVKSFLRPFVKYKMYRQTVPSNGSCPPPLGATKLERSRCATWVRRTDIIGPAGTNSQYYYLFEIVDKDGKRVQPYYDWYVSFQNWMSVKKPPNTAAAMSRGIRLGNGIGLQPGTSIMYPANAMIS